MSITSPPSRFVTFRRKPLVLYHSPCYDGLASAWVIWKHRPEYEFVPVNYNEPFDTEICRDRIVHIVDFSFKLPVMQTIVRQATHVIWLDHHAGAMEELAPLLLNIPHNFTYRFSTEDSGALVTWKYFNAGKEAPVLLEYVSDRDTWKFKLNYTRETMAYVFTFDLDFSTFDELVTRVQNFEESMIIVYQGKALLKQQSRNIAQILKSNVRKIAMEVPKEYWSFAAGPTDLFPVYKMAVTLINAPYFMASDVASEFLKANPDEVMVAIYHDEENGRKFSLRSTKEFSVIGIASYYGGGGHHQASGFRVPRDHYLSTL